jgi:hypothetical protein
MFPRTQQNITAHVQVAGTYSWCEGKDTAQKGDASKMESNAAGLKANMLDKMRLNLRTGMMQEEGMELNLLQNKQR